MRKHSRGFTLIELMIVVAIIAILAAIAIPAYQDYLIRSQVSESLSLSTGAKDGVWEFISNKGRYPGNNTSAGIALPTSISGNFITTVTVTNGLIVLKFGNKANTALTINSGYIQLSPRTHAGSIQWICTGSGIAKRYIPSPCT
jgi:type IV pilus assembly protein PilA